ncbi:MAG: tripartite tricarboxylate transporter TctB family protein [Rhodobacteraceae bacterium]|jgi:hypothetical protein|nr:tripartite tricarboxylate transporter TctB family protein [Paracoccaceae bacterium]
MRISQLTLKINHDFFGGLLLICISGGAWYHAQSYALGTLNRMGPGYLPVALSLILGGLGMMLLIISQFKPAERVTLRVVPMIIILGSLCIFGIMLRSAGLFPAAFTSVILATFADTRITWLGRVTLALVVSLFTGVVFVVGLGMSVPLWWS